MSGDVLTRLRDGCSECGLNTLYACTNEAADEIERLRKKLYQWERVAEIYRELHDDNAGRYAREDCACYGCEAYKQQTNREKAQRG